MNLALDFHTFSGRFSHEAESCGFHGKSLMETDTGPMTVWERGATGPLVYVSSGIHGDEPAGPLAMLALLEAGCFNPDIRWRLCPVINPDGLKAATRHNAAGIDLNRDYLKRRSLEIAAHAAWLETLPVPELFLSLHEDCDTTGFYLYEISQGGNSPAGAPSILKAVSALIPIECAAEIDGHVPHGDGWIFHTPEADEPEGWPEAIFLAKRGCPLSFTFETPSRLPLAQRVAAHVSAVEAAFRAAVC